MAKQQSGETKAPLVVALAFFVLTTLTLGVLTYMAYSDVAVQKAAAKQAESDKQAAVSKATEEQAKVLMYKTLVGTNTQEEFDNLKNGGKAEVAKQEYEAFRSAMVNRLKGVETKAAKDFVGTNKPFAISPEAVVAWNWTATLENPPQTPMIDAVANGYARQMLAAVRLETESKALDQAKQTYLDAHKRAQDAEAGFKKLERRLPRPGGRGPEEGRRTGPVRPDHVRGRHLQVHRRHEGQGRGDGDGRDQAPGDHGQGRGA